jgi:hypothetical protein
LFFGKQLGGLLDKTRVAQTGIASLTALILVFGGLWFTDASSSAKPSQRSICADRETRELKLRKNCRSGELFLADAEVLVKGGKSAYQTWLDLGNKGTQAQFIASLAGSSGGVSSFNPLANRRCSDALSSAENKFGKLAFYKQVWEHFEQNSSCKVTETYRDTIYAFPELNDITSNVQVTLDTSSSTTVRRFNNRPAEYLVPIKLAFTLNLREGWTVCSPSHPLYGNTNFSTTSDFARWAALENSRVPGTVSSYQLDTHAFIASSGIALGRTGEEDFEGLDKVALCKPDASSNLGWHLYRFYFYSNYADPRIFIGQGIHYISQWGWE